MGLFGQQKVYSPIHSLPLFWRLFTFKEYYFLPLSIIIAFTVHGFPHMVIFDMWDGVIIEHAVSEKNLEPLKNWFFESGWPLQYYFINVLNSISGQSGAKFDLVIILVTVLSIGFIANETRLLIAHTFSVGKTKEFLFSQLTQFYPVLSVLVSSVMTFHIFCVACALFATRKICSNSVQSKIIGVPIILFAMSLKSIFIFFPALLALRLFYNTSFKRNDAWKFLIFSSLAPLTFIFHQLFFPSYGLYEDYNTILNPFTWIDLKKILIASLDFVAYLIIPLPFFVTVLIICITLDKERFLKVEFFKVVVWPVFIISACIVAYLFVGKAPYIYDHSGFSQRQAILLPFGLTFAFVALQTALNSFLGQSTSLQSLVKFKISYLLVISFWCSCSYNLLLGYTYKLQIFEYQKMLEEVLINKDLKSGKVIIYDPDYPHYESTLYEANIVLYRTFRTAKWYAIITPQPKHKLVMDTALLEKDIYKEKYIFENISNFDCTTFLTIVSDGFNYHPSPFDLFKQSNKSMRIDKLERQCI